MRVGRRPAKGVSAGLGQGGRSSAQGRLGAEAALFSKALHDAARQEARALIQDMMPSVDEAAEKLRQSPTLEHLEAYKAAVRRVLQQAIQACYNVVEETGFDRGGRRRIYLLVRRADDELERLTRAFAERHQAFLATATSLDEIRGWLLDLAG